VVHPPGGIFRRLSTGSREACRRPRAVARALPGRGLWWDPAPWRGVPEMVAAEP